MNKLKNHKCPEFENHERWLVSYADMMTLLFALFVVLYALKNADPSDSTVGQVAAASAEVFSKSLEEIPLDKRKAPEMSGFGVFEHLKGTDKKTPLMRKFPNSKERNMIINDEVEKLKIRLEDPSPGQRRSTRRRIQLGQRCVSRGTILFKGESDWQVEKECLGSNWEFVCFTKGYDKKEEVLDSDDNIIRDMDVWLE